jgi:hypothetical protein
MGRFDEGMHVPARIDASTIDKSPFGVVLWVPIGDARLRKGLGKGRAHR